MATQTNNNKNFIGLIVMGVIVVFLLFVIFALAMQKIIDGKSTKMILLALIAAIAAFLKYGNNDKGDVQPN